MKKLKSYIIVILFTLNSMAICQWSTNPYENLQVAVHGGNIHAVPDGKGGAIITFNNFDYDVVTTYLQAVDRYGYLKWTEPKIIADGPGPQNSGVGLFSSDDDNYIFGYKSGYYIDSNLTIYSFFDPYIQKIDTNGNKLWGEYGIKLNPNSPSQQVTMFMCNDGNGGVYALWNISPPPDYSGYDSLFIQHISKDGERLWGENGIFIDDSLFSALNSWVIGDDSGGIYVQYRKKDTECYINKFNSQGNLSWTLSNSIISPIVIKDSVAGIIISGVVYSYPAHKLIINRISPEGEKLWGDGGIIIDDSVDNGWYNPAELFLNLDSTLTVFWDTDWWPNDDLYLQRYTLEGEPIWQERLKISDLISGKSRLGLVKSDDNSNIIVWGETRDTSGMYGQKIDQYGNRLWNEDKLVGTQVLEFNIITDGNNGAIIFWHKDPPWGPIMAQQINKNGNLGEIITSINDDNYINSNPSSFSLFQNHPNPFNPSTKISWHSPVGSWQTLKVYDILGREIATLVNEYRPAGKYEVDWNAVNLPSGVYFYTLLVNGYTNSKKMLLMK